MIVFLVVEDFMLFLCCSVFGCCAVVDFCCAFLFYFSFLLSFFFSLMALAVVVFFLLYNLGVVF